jgi:hypothetical protein
LSTLRAHGVEADLPAGFEARIYRRIPAAGERTYTVCQFATFPLPPGTGDFGNSAAELMTADDVLMVLFEYGPESVGRRLFAAQGMPGRLAVDHFAPTVLRRAMPGHSGTQRFFTEAGRPFTLYAVLGSHARRALLVPKLNTLLAGIRILPSPSPRDGEIAPSAVASA